MRNCVILGSGRSGTSMVAGSLASAGYYMGADHYPPRASNPKGFFESPDVNGANDAILAECGVRPPRGWLARLPLDLHLQPGTEVITRIRDLVAIEPFCFKDPRFSYTLPVWAPLLGDAVRICVFRDPAVTARSIVRECREADYLGNPPMDEAAAMELWAAMYRQILYRHRHHGEWVFLHYDQMLAGDGPDRLGTVLGAPVDTGFPDGALSRSGSGSGSPRIGMPREAEALYGELCALAGFDPDRAPVYPGGPPAVHAEPALARALEHHRREDWQPALTAYFRHLEHEPDDPEVLNLLGTLQCQVGEYARARDRLERAISAAPARADCLSNAGYACRQLGESAAALEYFRRALAQDPVHACARTNLGLTLMQVSLDESAVTDDARLSAVVTCYESDDSIGQTVMSLVNQTMPPDEIIVSDDGSDEQTCDYVRTLLEMAQRRGIDTRFVTHERTQPYRLNTVRNNGIAAATGDLVFYTDGDIIVPKGLLAAHRRIHASSQRSLYLFSARRELGELGDIDTISEWTERVIDDVAGRPWKELNLAPEQALPSASFKRALWEASGGFDEAFNGHWGFDEVEFVFRVKYHLGAQVSSAGMVYHIPHPAGAGARDAHRNHDLYLRKRADLWPTILAAPVWSGSGSGSGSADQARRRDEPIAAEGR